MSLCCGTLEALRVRQWSGGKGRPHTLQLENRAAGSALHVTPDSTSHGSTLLATATHLLRILKLPPGSVSPPSHCPDRDPRTTSFFACLWSQYTATYFCPVVKGWDSLFSPIFFHAKLHSKVISVWDTLTPQSAPLQTTEFIVWSLSFFFTLKENRIVSFQPK